MVDRGPAFNESMVSAGRSRQPVEINRKAIIPGRHSNSTGLTTELMTRIAEQEAFARVAPRGAELRPRETRPGPNSHSTGLPMEMFRGPVNIADAGRDMAEDFSYYAPQGRGETTRTPAPAAGAETLAALNPTNDAEIDALLRQIAEAAPGRAPTDLSTRRIEMPTPTSLPKAEAKPGIKAGGEKPAQPEVVQKKSAMEKIKAIAGKIWYYGTLSPIWDRLFGKT